MIKPCSSSRDSQRIGRPSTGSIWLCSSLSRSKKSRSLEQGVRWTASRVNMTRGSGPDWDSGGELLDGEEGECGELEEGCIMVRQSRKSRVVHGAGSMIEKTR